MRNPKRGDFYRHAPSFLVVRVERVRASRGDVQLREVGKNSVWGLSLDYFLRNYKYITPLEVFLEGYEGKSISASQATP